MNACNILRETAMGFVMARVPDPAKEKVTEMVVVVVVVVVVVEKEDVNHAKHRDSVVNIDGYRHNQWQSRLTY